MGVSTDEAGFREAGSQSDPLPVEEIEAALEAAKNLVRAIEEQIAALEEKLVSTKREQHLLEELVAIRRGKEPAKPYSRPRVPSLVSDSTLLEHTGDDVVDAAVAVLQDHESPMHIGELMTVLQDRNVRLPGQGTQANLISRLSRDERIIRTARGIYALRKWGLEEMPVSKRRSGKNAKRRRRPKSDGEELG